MGGISRTPRLQDCVFLGFSMSSIFLFGLFNVKVFFYVSYDARNVKVEELKQFRSPSLYPSLIGAESFFGVP